MQGGRPPCLYYRRPSTHNRHNLVTRSTPFSTLFDQRVETAEIAQKRGSSRNLRMARLVCALLSCALLACIAVSGRLSRAAVCLPGSQRAAQDRSRCAAAAACVPFNGRACNSHSQQQPAKILGLQPSQLQQLCQAAPGRAGLHLAHVDAHPPSTALTHQQLRDQWPISSCKSSDALHLD